MLERTRVLDLGGSHQHAPLCGQILADLGADVIAIEPPGGSAGRRVGPWLDGERGPERSLFWQAYARGKRSLVLDLETRDGHREFLDLVRGADFLIESFAPGSLARLGLGAEELAGENPALIHVSITPFGSSGPKANWPATDLTVAAAAATAWLSGERDRPPVRLSVPQAHAHAGTDAAVGALIAWFERRRSGLGQHVDVSMQESLTFATMFRSLDAPLAEAPARRNAGAVLVAGNLLQSQYRLRDGWVVIGPGILPSTGHFTKRLMRFAAERGAGDGSLADEDWGSFALRMVQGALPGDAFEPAACVLRELFSDLTQAELMEAADRRKLLLAPLLDTAQVLASPHFEARGSWREQPLSDDPRVLRGPGPWARFGRPPRQAPGRAPRLDEHGAELRAERERARPAAPATAASAPHDDRPLAGLRILDLFWVLAGPGATRMLADWGAEVIRVESTQRPDTLRVIPPYQFNNPHPEGAGAFHSANAPKLGITLDMGSAEGLAILKDLLAQVDVLTESFAPGVLEEIGLDPVALLRERPELIVLRSCLMGQDGPWRDFTGFGNLAASVTGFQQLASWPGRPPSGPFGAYTDFIAARYNAVALLGAVAEREHSGLGQIIDMSQAEAALHFIAPALLETQLRGRASEACGNADPDLRPHGFYPCLGEDRWVALAVRSSEERATLCDLVGRPELAGSGDEAALEDAIARWSAKLEAQQAQDELIARGIPAHVAHDTLTLHDDPQLHHREHYQEISHEIYGTSWVESSRILMSRTPPRAPREALHFGRDNRHILESLLGYAPEQIADLAARGVLS